MFSLEKYLTTYMFCALSFSHVWFFETSWTLPGSIVRGDSAGKNVELGCHALFQGILSTEGSNPGLLHCRWILNCCLSHQRSPRILEWVAYLFFRGSSPPRNWTGVFCTAGRFFTSWAIRETPHITLFNPYLYYFKLLVSNYSKNAQATHHGNVFWRGPMEEMFFKSKT